MKNMIYFVEMMISEYLPLSIITVTGLYFSFKTKFFQFKNLLISVKMFFSAKQNKSISKKGYSAVCTSLASTIGTGNIVGVATAVTIGGAGAIFWMIVSAFFGMIIKTVEICLSVKHTTKTDKGPYSYIKKAYKNPQIFFISYTIFCVLASFSTGNITQVNTISNSISQNITVKFIIGIITSLFIFIILSGGAMRIMRFSEIIVPIMSFLYIVLCFGIIIKNYTSIPTAFYNILKGTFNPSSVTGGAVGSVLICAGIGASRGIFSNEAGIGTSAFSHQDSEETPKNEAILGIFEVFVDTVVMCFLTGFVIILSGANIEYGNIGASNVIIDSFSSVYGKNTHILISIMLSIFGFTSTVGWGYFGIGAIKHRNENLIKIYVLTYSLFCVLGAVLSVSAAWRLAAFFNGVMLIINMASIMRVSNDAFDELNNCN